MWKSWCDTIATEGTFWGHGPEDSANYEPRTFLEVADILHYQGLSAKGHIGTQAWMKTVLRFMAARDSFALPACYGDCWDAAEYDSMEFFQILRDDWDWPAAQFAIDRMIRSYHAMNPKSNDQEGVNERYAWLNGSSEVGGLLPPSDPAQAKEELAPLLGLAALPMTEGFWQYMTGQIGNGDFWATNRRPEAIPYGRTADKVQYRSGWNINDEYLLLDTLGWANHGHMDLGAIVQYCQGGRLWIVDFGYMENGGPEYHSTLDVQRDGKPAWGQFGGEKGTGRGGEFRSGPQIFEIVKLDPDKPGVPGRFNVVCRANNLAGATWVRSVSGGEGKSLTIEDTLTAEEGGEYQAIFRLRLLGTIEGADGKWLVRQKDASLPVILETIAGDEVEIGKRLPEDTTHAVGSYPWYPFTDGGGIPKTIEWKRKIKLDRGQKTVFRARLGPP
jgi:hypothetical protein